MTLRIKTAEDLERLKPGIREQVEGALEGKLSSGEDPGLIPLPRAPVKRHEEQVGRQLVEWIDLLVFPNGLRPGLFFYHVPNGLARNATEGGIFKAQGLRAGWPDYCLDLPVGRYHGFRLEIKAALGPKPTADQLTILARLESVGYKCGVAWGFDDGKRQLEQYWHELVDRR